MAGASPNLFGRLHKWAARQDENFLTESLALVLQFLLERAPSVGVRLLGQLTDGFLRIQSEDAGTVDVSTQTETSQGRPDLTIRAPNCLVVVEVKVESEVRAGQLEGYRLYLGESGSARTQLVLLTRYPPTYAEGGERPDLSWRWYEVGWWVEEELSREEFRDEIGRFLCEQFVAFLRARNMTIAQVDWHLPDGLRSLRNLLSMLAEAARACHVSAKPDVDRESIGVYLEGKNYWVGFSYSEPEFLIFHTDWYEVRPPADSNPPIGEIYPWTSMPNKWAWRRKVNLTDEETHFFSRPKVGQMEWLERFIRESLDTARGIGVSQQPPPPPVSSEG
jgi:hypothetical protein